MPMELVLVKVLKVLRIGGALWRLRKFLVGWVGHVSVKYEHRAINKNY